MRAVILTVVDGALRAAAEEVVMHTGRLANGVQGGVLQLSPLQVAQQPRGDDIIEVRVKILHEELVGHRGDEVWKLEDAHAPLRDHDRVGRVCPVLQNDRGYKWRERFGDVSCVDRLPRGAGSVEGVFARACWSDAVCGCTHL